MRTSGGPLLLLMAVLGCAGGDEVTDGDLAPSVATIHGVVRGPGSAPVADAHVQVFIDGVSEDCTGDAPSPAGTASTGPDGAYAVVAGFLHVAREDLCVRVHVAPDAESGLGEADVHGGTVTFIHESRTPPMDSLRVDVVLPQSAGVTP